MKCFKKKTLSKYIPKNSNERMKEKQRERKKSFAITSAEIEKKTYTHQIETFTSLWMCQYIEHAVTQFVEIY